MKTPTLRFKDFVNPWQEISFGEISANVMYGMNAAAIPYDGINKYIRITDIDEETHEFVPSPLTSPDGLISDKFKLKKNDLVFARTGASVGKTYLYNEKDGNLLFAGFLVKLAITGADPYFIYTKTLTAPYKSWLKVISMRSGQPGVNAEELKEFRFLAPQMPEQKKIADFLATIDEKLSQLTKKQRFLTQYKKGVMQQIFSRKLRFKDNDGKDFPEWNEVALNELCDLQKGKQLNKSKLNDFEEFPVINGGQEPSGYTNTWNTEANTITISEGGNSCGFVNFIKQKFWSGGHCYSLVNIKVGINNFFLYQTLKFYEERIKRLRVGSGLPNIQKTAISSFTFKIPMSNKEQIKIANFFDAIDKKIASIQSQLELVKQYKQGLLQQMFV